MTLLNFDCAQIVVFNNRDTKVKRVKNHHADKTDNKIRGLPNISF